MVDVTRRGLLGAGAGGLAAASVLSVGARAASFGNPDEPAQGAINANPGSVRDPGPQNAALASQFPDAQSPPATDIGDMPQFWASFNNAHKRIQNGGWARQVTQADLPISEDIAGVNMRLAAGGIRELHWHQAAEWGFMTYGDCRVTVIDPKGRAYVQDVQGRGSLVFPRRLPAFPPRTRTGRLRVPHRIRRRARIRIQHVAGHRLVCAHAAQHTGEKLRRSCHGIQLDSATRFVDFPGKGTRISCA
jgi:hypothetical protein